MPLYNKQRDLKMFHMVNRELLTKIIDTVVNIYKLSIAETEDNLYGESQNKIYFPDVICAGLIDHSDTSPSFDEKGYDYTQTLEVGFNRQLLEEACYYPEEGDVIEWNTNYYEIVHTAENQLVGGQQDSSNHNWSIVCTAVLTDSNKTQIKDLDRYVEEHEKSLYYSE